MDIKDQAPIGQAMTPMPKYRSHKEVFALKIAAIAYDCDAAKAENRDSDGSATITPADRGYAPFTADHAYVVRHLLHVSADQIVGGYYVQYDDGYLSFSPAKAFEEGYTRLGASVGGDALPAKGSGAPLTVDEHRARHVLLHQRLDELFADFIAHQPLSVTNILDMPIRDLLTWSHAQTLNPTEKP